MAKGPTTKLTDQHASKIPQTTLLVVTWTLFGIACLFFVARSIVRLTIFRRFFADDVFVLLALIILTANAIVTTFMAPPMYEVLLISIGAVPPTPAALEQGSLYLKLQFASTILFWSCLWSVKGCFLAFFYRLTDNLQKHRRIWWGVVVITVLAYIGCIITYPVSCTSFKLGDCQAPINVERSLISLRFSTAVDVLTDALIIAIPIFLCYQVRISLKQKLGLSFALSLGVVIIVFSVVRIIVTNTTDAHPEVSWLAMWSSIECSVAVVVACLTSFKALLVDRQRNQTNQYSRDGRRYYHHYGSGKDSRLEEKQSRSRSERQNDVEMFDLPNTSLPSSNTVISSDKAFSAREDFIGIRHPSSESQARILSRP